MILLRIALRNLSRNRRRTLLSLLVVTAGTIGLLLTAGFIRFSFDGLREALITGGLGHLELVQSVALERSDSGLDRSLAHGLSDWSELRSAIEETHHVVAAGANIHLMGMISAGDRSVSFVGVGAEPQRESKMSFEVKLRDGEVLPDLAPREGEDRVLLATGLAGSLAVTPGDVVTILGLTPDGMLNALDIEVAGIITTGIQELDLRYLKVHLATAQRLLQTDLVSDLVVALDDTANTEVVAGLLRRGFADHDPALSILDWRERAPFFDQVRNLYLGIFWFLGSVIFVLVVLSVSNTLLMTFMERIREIGTLRAIGTSRAQVARIVLFEALWLGLFGALLGDLIGLLLITSINSMKLKMPPPPGAVAPIDLQLALVPEAFAGAVGLMVFVLAGAALIPIIKTARLAVVEALSHV